jgi:hypothetical protein
MAWYWPIRGNRYRAGGETDHIFDCGSRQEKGVDGPYNVGRQWFAGCIQELHAGISVQVAVSIRRVSDLDGGANVPGRGTLLD